MELVPCPVRGRRIPGRDAVEEDRQGHMKWDLVAEDLPGPGHEQESQTG